MEDPDKLWNGILNDIKQGKYEQQYKDVTRGWNFLNIAIKHNAPEKVVLDFIERLPDLIEKIDKDGNLPLHSELKKENPNLQIIRTLLDKYPKSITVTDKYQEFPKDMALKIKDPGLNRAVNEIIESKTQLMQSRVDNALEVQLFNSINNQNDFKLELFTRFYDLFVSRKNLDYKQKIILLKKLQSETDKRFGKGVRGRGSLISEFIQQEFKLLENENLEELKLLEELTLKNKQEESEKARLELLLDDEAEKIKKEKLELKRLKNKLKKQLKKELKNEEGIIQNKAASLIQAKYAGFKTRQQQKNRAAGIIQANYKGFKTRQQFNDHKFVNNIIDNTSFDSQRYQLANRKLVNQDLLYNYGYNKQAILPATQQIPGAVLNGQDYAQTLNVYRKPNGFGKNVTTLKTLRKHLNYVKS